MNTEIGCQGWNYDDWTTKADGETVFYPRGTKSGEMLEIYAKVFDTISMILRILNKGSRLRLVKQNQLVEQGLFCRITPVGNHFKYDEKGKLVYKMIYTKSMAKLSCAKPDFTGTEATEEVYDKNGFKIFGTYKDGLKQGRWLYYDNTNAIIGYEDFEKGQSRLRKGKVFTNRADGGFDIAKN